MLFRKYASVSVSHIISSNHLNLSEKYNVCFENYREYQKEIVNKIALYFESDDS